jgi:perosamine synthetase
MSLFSQASSLIAGVFRPSLLGFFHGHDYLTHAQLARIRESLAAVEEPATVGNYERAFAAAVGAGEAISYAAGRMAFYCYLRALGIREGDEVLLTGYTCSVMANAIWRTGATPRYADIARDTLGTDPISVAAAITPHTRLVVAQHSYGIPCAVDEVATICRQRGVPLLEDCALSFGSTLDGRAVGDWGDAAIFSGDHSKPLNTLAGGMLYTRDHALATRLREENRQLPTFDRDHLRRLHARFEMERRYLRPGRYGLGCLLGKLAGLRRKFVEKFTGNPAYVLLNADFKPRIKSRAYPYPAQHPAFLAQLGIYEIERWPAEAARRRELLAAYLQAAAAAGIASHLPAACTDPRRNIVPLRFAYTHPLADEISRRLRGHLDLDWVWFSEPVNFAPQGPESYGYIPGSCPVAEATGRQIINWPGVVPASASARVIELFRKVHRALPASDAHAQTENPCT